jgi:hypothetical protein
MFANQHWLVVNCLTAYIIETYKKNLFVITLLLDLLTNLGHIYCFCELLKWKFFNEVWFTIVLIGWNHLQLSVDKFTIDFSDLINKFLSNKISCGIGITQIEESIVPWEYGMEIMRHWNPISYGK